MRSRPESVVSVVVLAFGAEPLLARCVQAILRSEGVRVDIVVVDNGCTSDAVLGLDGLPGVRVLTPSGNTGFAGGCNLGATSASGAALVFVNSDAIVEPQTVSALTSKLADPDVGIASGNLRLIDRPDLMNSAGNPVHFLGLSWAGGLGEPATSHAVSRPLASATGALMALRRQTWEALGGFYEPMFAYCEDTELSLRCWQRGWSVEYVPEAVALHAYEFHRSPLKMYLLERNRLVLIMTVYARRTLWLLALPLVGLELAVLVVSVRQGWWREKASGWWWLAVNFGTLRRRRRQVQTTRTRSDALFVPLLTDSFTPGPDAGFSAPPSLSTVSGWYWAGVRRWIT